VTPDPVRAAGRRTVASLLATAGLACAALGCAGGAPVPADGSAAGRETPEQTAARTATTQSLSRSVRQVAAGFTNLGRFAEVRRRAEQLELGSLARSEWIDWFSVQRNLMIELPGRSPQLIYVVAHYDKVDGTLLEAFNRLLNGLFDPLLSPFYLSSGAIDNATGVSVALEVANALRSRPHQYTYRILLVGSEESGLRGSRAHVARLPQAEKDAIALAIVIDTTGVSYAGNCLIDVGEQKYVQYARRAATSLGFELGVEPAPFGASSDFEPFQSTSFAIDFGRGLKFNQIGGLLPQRSWFTGPHEAPVLFLSSCELLEEADYLGGLIGLPIGRLHGPRDRLARVDEGRLYEAYAITLRLIEQLEQANEFGP
jgi:hypothetical protein